MSEKKKEPLYKVVSGWILMIGVGASVLSFAIMVIVELGILMTAIAGIIDFETMHSINDHLEDEYGWYFFSLLCAWYPGIMLGFMIDGIGNKLTKYFASS